MGLALFIPIMLMLLIGVYVGCFKDEFDNENLNTVWAVVGVIIYFWCSGQSLQALVAQAITKHKGVHILEKDVIR